MTPTIMDLVARLDAAAIALDNAGSNPITMQGGGVRSTLTPTRAKQYAKTAVEAASALQAQATALRLCATMAGNSAYNLCHATGTVEDAIRSFEQIETTALRATREGGE